MLGTLTLAEFAAEAMTPQEEIAAQAPTALAILDGWQGKDPARAIAARDSAACAGTLRHAPARHVWSPGGKWGRVTGIASVADGHDGSVVMSIIADGRELWHSARLREGETAFDLATEDAQRLELIVSDAGDGNRSNWVSGWSRRCNGNDTPASEFPCTLATWHTRQTTRLLHPPRRDGKRLAGGNTAGTTHKQGTASRQDAGTSTQMDASRAPAGAHAFLGR